MTAQATETYNDAGPGATIGIQAASVHGSNVYQVFNESSPAEKYRVGVRFLENGAPNKAHKLIDEAIACGHDTAEAHFHRALSLLSKRPYRDLTSSERDRLLRLPKDLTTHPDDDWKRASDVVCELLACMEDPDSDHTLALQDLDALPRLQHDRILRHLDQILTGHLKDSVWSETLATAMAARADNGRTDRVWAYFHPDPAKPRRLKGPAAVLPHGAWPRAVAWSAPFVFALGHLIWSALINAEPLPILSLLLLAAAGYVALHQGREWHFRAGRLKEKEHEHAGRFRRERLPEEGFTDRVDDAFSYYFGKYRPKDAKRKDWLTDSVGIRTTLRDEVVELYRESRTPAEKIHWLIRFMARDVRDRWESDTLFDFRDRYAVAGATKLWCWISCLTLAPASAGVLFGALQANPLTAALAAVASVVTGRFAVPWWLYISSEYRRAADTEQERAGALAERRREYDRWKSKLDSTRPSEEEMEEWLNCDKTVILNDALKQHSLAWHDILGHAFLQAPHRPCKRARVTDGPWRYSKYNMVVFLLTEDGVREVGAKLDFERAQTDGQQRDNFRFESISSVHVDQTAGSGYTLSLTLMNGEPKRVLVNEPESDPSEPDEDPEEITEISLDAAGFSSTLRILEGIAAEGKNWLDRDRRSGPSGHTPPGDWPD
ncbi:hypothetical protein [Nocardiopsis suaedae]|uniref:DUF4231 domain-containing protein n=1 Tax=Nocardiopsis suaedae TaxID=3018444 RepID=A0ABT4TQ97_9ACTN|nr:hypothetical protein [Nocardiopsis suaedae]MDA2806864.1 hypothetical protein [Nocardiopsis suaedae]